MDKWIERLSERKGNPRLWIERLVLFGKPDLEHAIRAISFRRGLNLIWAKEPDDRKTYTGIHAAGHGVGKTSLCLLLRYCLGDDAGAVVDLCEMLHGEYPQGGVAALIHVRGESFAVFRHFGAQMDGMARVGCDLETLLGQGGDLSFRDFKIHLEDAMLSAVSPRFIPETGQAIRWEHLLGWITRDQGTGFKRFYAWRDGEGTGLRRSRQDPPFVVRAVLGLMDLGESEILERIHEQELERETCEQEARRIRLEPELIRARIESDLRAWADADKDLPLFSEDLFTDSVEKRIRAAMGKASKGIEELKVQIEQVDREWVEASAQFLLRQRAYEEADAEYRSADAAQQSDEAAFAAIRDRLGKLRGLAGQKCLDGGVDFGECHHVEAEILRLESGIASVNDHRNRKELSEALVNWTRLAVAALDRRDSLQPAMEAAEKLVSDKARIRSNLQEELSRLEAENAECSRLRKELDRWKMHCGANETEEAIRNAGKREEEIAKSIQGLKGKLALLQAAKSNRERQLSDLVDALARALLPDGAFGLFSAREDERPFQLSIRGGEAYRVLEVLLGDLACLLDSSSSAFPGFLIHDCPREADMSAGLYEAFLLLAERAERESFGDAAPFQYIVTTTTPPPTSMQELPYLRETLDPRSDEGLLFKRRFRQQVGNEPLPGI